MHVPIETMFHGIRLLFGLEMYLTLCELSYHSGSGRSPGVGNGYPLQYSHLENPMDRGAWWATVHGVTNSWT